MKSYIRMGKAIIKFEDIEIQTEKFNQHKRPVSIKQVDIDRIVVHNRFLLVKKDLNILLVAKMLKELNFYVYISPKSLRIENTLMKLSIYLF